MVQVPASVHDYWKNCSFDYTDLCRQSDVSAFWYTCLSLSQLFFQGASVFWFHGCSHHPQWFWSPKKENLSLLPLFPLFTWSDGTGFHGLSFLIVEFQANFFHFLLSPSLRGSSVRLHFLPLEWHRLHFWSCCYFSRQSWFLLVIHPVWRRISHMSG